MFVTPKVNLSWGSYSGPRTGQESFKGSFAMVLEFGEMKDGKLASGIHVCLPDEGKRVLAGRFEIEGLALATIK